MIPKIKKWIPIWILTFILLKIHWLEKYELLIDIINSSVFSYISIDIIINKLEKNKKLIVILIIMIIFLHIIPPIRKTIGLILCLFITIIFFIDLSNSFIEYKLRKTQLIKNTFIYLSIFLLYIAIFYFIDKEKLTPEYLCAPFFFEIIKMIINSMKKIKYNPQKSEIEKAIILIRKKLKFFSLIKNTKQ